MTNRVIFNFEVFYEYEDKKEYLDYPFVVSYTYNKYDGTTEEDSIYFDKQHSSGFTIRKSVADEPDIYDESFDFIVSSHSELFEKDTKTIELDEDKVGGYTRRTTIEDKFVLQPIVDDIKEIAGKFDRTVNFEDVLLTEYERVFGNNDVLIIWHDGKAMNLKYTEAITSNYEADITDNTVDISRMSDKSYISRDLNTIELELTLGDVWKKDGPNGSYKKQNRNSALRTIHELYDKNIPLNLRSDIMNIDTGLITEYDVSQSSDSDNTYEVSCVITEVKFIQKLPSISLFRDEDGDYHELPGDEPFQVKLYVDEEEIEEERGEGFIGQIINDYSWLWQPHRDM